jgi:hypothetical protein
MPLQSSSNADSGTRMSRTSNVIPMANTLSLNASIRPVAQRLITARRLAALVLLRALVSCEAKQFEHLVEVERARVGHARVPGTDLRRPLERQTQAA